MALNDLYLDTIAAANPITHVQLVDSEDNPVGDGPKAVGWTSPSSGDVSLDDDYVFNMQAGDDVAGWEGLDAASGGNSYGIIPVSAVSFSNDGTYTLLASQTSIAHNAQS